MKVYLDMCCYNRPYDPQDQMSISLETQAKLFIQEWIKSGKLDLVNSYTLDYEVSNVPQEERRDTIRLFIHQYAAEYVGIENQSAIEGKAREIMSTGVKEKDAAHVATAILTHCDYFISTDKRLLRYKTDEVKMCNPIEAVLELEGL